MYVAGISPTTTENVQIYMTEPTEELGEQEVSSRGSANDSLGA